MSENPAPELIPETSLESAIAVALKLARFRQTRLPLERDEVYARAAEAVVQSFRRCGWQVFKMEPYRGWGPEGSGPFMRQQPPPRCEICDD